MGNVLIEETSLDSVGDAIREQLDVSTKYKVSEMPDAIRSISGGGGGTTNYNNLSNKPQINTVTLEGNKTSTELGLQSELTFDNTPTDGSTNPVTSDGIYDAFAGVDTALSGKVDTTSVGVANGIAELDNDGLVPSSQLPDVDYTDVTNKPSINSVTLSGNKTAADLGLVNNTDLTDIISTGPTNATGNTITSGLYFYLDGVLCKAKSDIANGATFTLNTNYEVVTAGGLNSLNSALSNQIRYSDVNLGDITMNASGYLDIRSYIPAAPTGYGLLYVVLIGVTANSKADVPEIQGNGAYAYGEASKTYRSVSLRYIFLKIST